MDEPEIKDVLYDMVFYSEPSLTEDQRGRLAAFLADLDERLKRLESLQERPDVERNDAR